MDSLIIIPSVLFIVSLIINFFIAGKASELKKSTDKLYDKFDDITKAVSGIEKKLFPKERIEEMIDNRVLTHETKHHLNNKKRS